MNTNIRLDDSIVLKIRNICKHLQLDCDVCIVLSLAVLLGRIVIQDASASIVIFSDAYTEKQWNFRIEQLTKDMSCRELYQNIADGLKKQIKVDADIKLIIKDGTVEVNAENYFTDIVDLLTNYIETALTVLVSTLWDMDTTFISSLQFGMPQEGRISGKNSDYTDIGVLLQNNALLNWNQIAVERIYKRSEQDGFLVQTITYRELMGIAYNIAQELQIKRVSSASIIVTNGIELAVGIIGCIMAGCTYIPIDQNISGRQRTHHSAEEASTEGILYGAEIENIELIDLYKTKIRICMNECPDTPKWRIPTGNEKAYIIRSSGSMGTPKGIIISRNSLSNLVSWRLRQYPLNDIQSILQLLSWGFDGFYSDFFLGLCGGRRLIIPDPNLRTETSLFSFLKQREQAMMTSMVSSLFEYIVNSQTGLVKKLARVVLGGEKIRGTSIQKAKELNPSMHIVNEYGPSENTIVSFVCDPISDENVNCIGKPIDGVYAYILDRMGQPVLPGVTGELYIGGIGLMEGYEGKEDNKFIRYGSEILFQSGDLVRQSEIGLIEFISIKDKYAKCFGHYVDMQAVEDLIKEQLPVRDSCVFCSSLSGKDNLIALYVADKNIPAEYLTKLPIPPFAIPADWQRVDKMIHTDSGKVDRLTMKDQYEQGVALHKDANNGVCDLEQVIETVYEMFRQIIPIPRSAICANFFDIGFKSLQLLKVFNKLTDKYPESIELIDLFEYTSISAISERIYNIIKARDGRCISK